MHQTNSQPKVGTKGMNEDSTTYKAIGMNQYKIEDALSYQNISRVTHHLYQCYQKLILTSIFLSKEIEFCMITTISKIIYDAHNWFENDNNVGGAYGNLVNYFNIVSSSRTENA